MSAVADLLHDYQHLIEELVVRTGSKGVFDVDVDGTMLFSKGVEGRHANPGEVLARFREFLGAQVTVYPRD